MHLLSVRINPLNVRTPRAPTVPSNRVYLDGEEKISENLFGAYAEYS